MCKVYRNDCFLVSSEILKAHRLSKLWCRYTLSTGNQREKRYVTREKMCEWHEWKLKVMTTLRIALIVKRIELNLRRTCHGIATTCKVVIAGVFRHCRLSEFYVQRIVLINPINWLLSKILLMKKFDQLRELLSWLTSSAWETRLGTITKRSMRRRFLVWRTLLSNKFWGNKRPQTRWNMLFVPWCGWRRLFRKCLMKSFTCRLHMENNFWSRGRVAMVWRLKWLILLVR